MSVAASMLEKFADIHPLPQVVTTVNNLITDPDSTMKDFEDVIKLDPVLVARLLTLVNSPFYGLSQTVDSIGRAIAFLGMKNLHNLIVADALKGMFSKPAKNSAFSRKKLWIHSATVSICAKMIAERIFQINGDDAFLCGILHDFGLLVEYQIKPEEVNIICSATGTSSSLTDLERKLFQTDHCEIGHTMTLNWNMPTSLQQAIRDHHIISEDITPSSLTGIMQISDYIANSLESPAVPGFTCPLSSRLTEHLQENEDEYQVLIEDIPEELEKAKAIYS